MSPLFFTKMLKRILIKLSQFLISSKNSHQKMQEPMRIISGKCVSQRKCLGKSKKKSKRSKRR